MVTYETVKEDIIEFGKNNFIEISQKITLGSDIDYTKEPASTFVSIARGYYIGDKKIYKHSIAIPHDKEIIGKIVTSIFRMYKTDKLSHDELYDIVSKWWVENLDSNGNTK